MAYFRNQHFAFTIAVVLILCTSISNAVSISEALQNYPNFSSFVEILTQHKDIETLLNTNAPKTLLVPSNLALQQRPLSQFTFTEQQALLRYHVLNGSYTGTSFAAAGGATIKTYLEDSQFANLDGQANVIFTSKYGDSGVGSETKLAQVFSGTGQVSAIQPMNITFDGGIVHAVDSFLSLPKNCTSTAKETGLNGLLTALRRTDLATYVDTTPRITCFAPSDAAFNKSGSPDQNLSKDLLTQALKYHTLQGNYIGYTDSWQDGQELTTLAGETVVVKRAQGFWWVNDVKVLKANVVTSNGVAHVLDGVLSPSKKTQPNSTISTNSPSSTPTETQKSSSTVQKATTTLMLALSLVALYILL